MLTEEKHRRILREELRQAEVPQFITKKQLADALQISPRTADTLIAEGSIPSIKVGRCRRIPVSAVEEYTKRQQRREAEGRAR